MIHVLTFLLLLGGSFLIRWLPGRNAATNFDTWFYLLSTAEVRRRGIARPGPLCLRMLPTSGIDVPLLWQRLMALLPARVLSRHHNAVGAVMDALFACSIFYLAQAAGLRAESALLMTLLYLFTPMWFTRLSIGPRVHSLTPRLTSEICANLIFILLYAGLPIDNTVAIGTAVLLASFLLMSSKFGVQVLFFMLPATAAILRDPTGIVVLATAVAACVILTRGAFLTTLSAQGRHLRSYFLKNLRGEMPMARRNSLAPVKRIMATAAPLHIRLGRLALHLLVLNSFSAVLLKQPVAVAAGIIYLVAGPRLLTTVAWAQWGAPLMAALLVYLVINIRYFLFLGEAERYLNHAAFFIVGVAVVGAPAAGMAWLPWALLAYGAAYWLFEAFGLHRFERKQDELEHERQELVRWLNTQPPTTVALYPYHAIGVWRVLHETPHTVIYPARTNSEDEARFAEFDAAYPYFNIDRFPDMACVYGCRLLIVGGAEKSAVESVRRADGWEEVPCGTAHHVLFRASGAAADRST